MMRVKVFELLSRGEQVRSSRIAEAELADLPEVVQRYLRYTRVVGKEAIQTVRLKQKGVMKTRPDRGWLPMTAEQYCTTQPPAFVWHGVILPFPLVSIEA